MNHAEIDPRIAAAVYPAHVFLLFGRKHDTAHAAKRHGCGVDGGKAGNRQRPDGKYSHVIVVKQFVFGDNRRPFSAG